MRTSTFLVQLLLPALLSCAGCSRQSSWQLSPAISNKDEIFALSVPYVSGDVTGALTDRIITSLSSLPHVSIQDSSRYTLSVAILDEKEEKIGYRYARQQHEHRKLIPNENRSQLLVSVSVIDQHNKRTLFGPAIILGAAEYDHENSTIDNNILSYSMGQLADIDTAQDVTYIPLYRDVANKIALWIQNQRESNQKESNRMEVNFK